MPAGNRDTAVSNKGVLDSYGGGIDVPAGIAPNCVVLTSINVPTIAEPIQFVPLTVPTIYRSEELTISMRKQSVLA